MRGLVPVMRPKSWSRERAAGGLTIVGVPSSCRRLPARQPRHRVPYCSGMRFPVAVLVPLILAAACADAKPVSSTATATAIPTATATPGSLPLRVGSDAPFPRGMTLYIETGCSRCDGGPDGLYAVRVGEDGQSIIEQRATALPGVYYGSLMSVNGTLWTQMAPDGFFFCIECFPSSLTVYRSDDGGRTYAEAGRITGRRTSAAVALDDDLVLQSMRTYRRLGGTPIEPAPGASARPPVAVSGDSIGWVSDTGNVVHDDNGNALATLPPGHEIWRLTPLGQSRSGAFAVYSQVRPDGANALSVTESGLATSEMRFSGGHLLSLVTIPDTAATPGLLFFSARQDGASAMFPSIVDVQAGVLHEIRDVFSAPPFAGERNHIVGVR